MSRTLRTLSPLFATLSVKAVRNAREWIDLSLYSFLIILMPPPILFISLETRL